MKTETERSKTRISITETKIKPIDSEPIKVVEPEKADSPLINLMDSSEDSPTPPSKKP